uniref:Uncharacterized protein n=1 Tax=Tarenaya spinosa TaxID=228870 RepID=Q1KUV9_9ROSI|nr:hypothetical protein [Tarenaya spinosa]
MVSTGLTTSTSQCFRFSYQPDMIPGELTSKHVTISAMQYRNELTLDQRYKMGQRQTANPASLKSNSPWEMQNICLLLQENAYAYKLPAKERKFEAVKHITSHYP